ncbi:equilibrative nucleoside transporter 2 [Galendromus occidentalis]|uniref:Equilibrative nucleoside transporter 2 n=1 Tax=Galendromus occidentalis TaxID=34638 RepID=A0AAJ6VZ32_9ACAR|nr:equilibrative nucleoside transporter 2 [Galendromus occidentalis]
MGVFAGLKFSSKSRVYRIQQQAFASSQNASPRRAPKDPFNFAAFTIFLFGIASLLPWNFFITATDYWNYKFRDPSPNSTTDTTPLQKSFNSYLAIASKLPYIIFLVVNTAIANKIRCSVRIGYSLFICIVLFIATAALVKIDTDLHQKEFLAATLCIVVLINVVCGFLQGGGTGLAGTLPAKYMATNVMGQAAGGVFATLCQLVCLLCDTHPTDSALLYFGIATVVLIITQICFWILVRMDFYAFYMAEDKVLLSYHGKHQIDDQKKSTPFWGIFKAGWMFYIATVLIFWVTLAVFPAITALVRSSDASNGSAVTNKLFIPLACFVVFNFSDLFGRLLAKYLPIPASQGAMVLALSVTRILFIPLFLICNVSPGSRNLTPILLDQDWHYVLVMFLFGASNGYVTTLSLTYAAKASAPEHQEVAGSLAAVFLGLGLALGSLSSYLTLQLL